MPFQYSFDTDIKYPALVLDEYVRWFMNITRSVFYPDNSDDEGQGFTCPASFALWRDEALGSDVISSEDIKNLDAIHDNLCRQADNLIGVFVKSGKPPELQEFNKFSAFFEEFINYIRQIEQDIVLEISGMDILTGLRNQSVMQKDIMQEMDRLARHGKSFSIALLRIDGFEELQDDLGTEICDRYVKLVADLIKKSVRSFDDAYYISGGMYVLSLKQTVPSGGIHALNRLKEELERQGSVYEVGDGNKIDISLSSCVAEPMQSDDIVELLENLKLDLDGYSSNEGAVLEYYELSPLQRYVKNTQD